MGLKKLQRGEKTKMSKYFQKSEFACKCDRCIDQNNTGDGMDPRLLEVLDRIRERIGNPIYVLSGYRCPDHNAEVGGQPNSLHMQSCAADITYDGINVPELAQIAAEEGADGIGTYASQGFLHVDTRGYEARWDESDY
jgi:uncharacterized protein YcbK (DUF882 family)